MLVVIMQNSATPSVSPADNKLRRMERLISGTTILGTEMFSEGVIVVRFVLASGAGISGVMVGLLVVINAMRVG